MFPFDRDNNLKELTVSKPNPHTEKQSCRETEILFEAGMESIANGIARIKLAVEFKKPLDNLFKKVQSLLFTKEKRSILFDNFK